VSGGRADPVVRQLDVVTHEAAHAAAALLLGHRFDSVEIDRPVEGSEGSLMGLDAYLDAFDLEELETRLELAVIARLGSMVAGHPWVDGGPRSDRAKAERLCPSAGWPLETWLDVVDRRAKDLRGHPAFERLVTLLSFELFDRRILSYKECADLLEPARREAEEDCRS
jgi:hypothetical protein